MQTIERLTETHLDQDTVLTIGTFDGIHVGHRAILDQLVARARDRGCLSGMVTFHPHPRSVLMPNGETELLTMPEEKRALVEQLGLDMMALLCFTRDLAALSAQDFVGLLSKHLRMKELWVGPNFALGRGKEGRTDRLIQLGHEIGFAFHVIQPVSNDGRMVSSTEIRALLRVGNVAAATRYLARYYSVTGVIIPGAQRGRRIGIPTANIQPPPTKLIPAHGVYAAFADLDGCAHKAIVNIGVRPSFDNGERSIEAHLLDDDLPQALYGHEMRLRFVQRLRAEMRFPSPEALVAQIRADADDARHILGEALPLI